MFNKITSLSKKLYLLIFGIRTYSLNIRDFFGKINSWNFDRAHLNLRILVLISVFFAGYFVTFVKLVNISVFNEEDIKENFYNPQKILTRKEIVDRNGELLAVNLSSASLYANPKLMINIRESLDKLSLILPNLDKNKLLIDLNPSKTFVWIKRNLTPQEQYEIHNLGIPGLSFENEKKRVYTYSNLLSHVIGFVDRDGRGLAGLEKYYDEWLLNEDDNPDLKNHNKALELTIDIRLQDILVEEISKSMKKFSGVGAAGIIADVTSGEILAMASLPDFDPHHPSKADVDSLFNRATLGLYELGSVTKTLAFVMGLDSNKITLYDLYDLNQPVKVSKFTIKDYHGRGGWRSVSEIFMHSSNIGLARIILELGKDQQQLYLKNLGLFDKLSVELVEKATPVYPSKKNWTDLSAITIGYGYGFSISPLHLVHSMIPIVNGGTLRDLTLIKNKSTHTENQNKKVLETSTSETINKLLRLVVSHGTGRKANVQGLLVGGKTGTANKLKNGKYVDNARISSFISVFPMINPKYCILIVVDQPKGIAETGGYATAGYVAAPVVKEIITKMSNLYKIEVYNEDSPEIQEIMHVDYTPDNGT